MSETNAERFERINEYQGAFKNGVTMLRLLEDDVDFLIEYVHELEELKAHYMKQIQELTRFNDKGIKENKLLDETLKALRVHALHCDADSRAIQPYEILDRIKIYMEPKR